MQVGGGALGGEGWGWVLGGIGGLGSLAAMERFGLVYWGLKPQQQPGSYQGGEMMMMTSVFWWRKAEYPEETTDLRQVTDETVCYFGFAKHPPPGFSGCLGEQPLGANADHLSIINSNYVVILNSL